MMFNKYWLVVLLGIFLMVGCQKEVIVPTNGTSVPTYRNGVVEGENGGKDENGGITDPNVGDQDEDEDGDITDPNNTDEDEESSK